MQQYARGFGRRQANGGFILYTIIISFLALFSHSPSLFSAALAAFSEILRDSVSFRQRASIARGRVSRGAVVRAQNDLKVAKKCVFFVSAAWQV